MPNSLTSPTKTAEKTGFSVSDETTKPDMISAQGFSVIEAEVAQFSKLAEKWWDVKGEFAPLHRFNPTRVRFIRDEALKSFGRDYRRLKPFEGLSLLDVGCGGGLLSEPMRRIGFAVTGLDASPENIGTASAHAGISELEINYICQTVEQHALERNVITENHHSALDSCLSIVECEKPASTFSHDALDKPLYDVVLCMEVIEHVADPEAFLKVAASLVKPGGLLITATLSRTLKAFALAIVGAEYLLGWVPKGTHDWNRFLKPSEIEGFLAGTGLSLDAPTGVSFDPLKGEWQLTGDTEVNFMICARRI